MKVYIASTYKNKINNLIFNELKKESIDVFLPESININAISEEEKYKVSEIWYEEIERCDVILLVCPFGKSVSVEAGYAIALKRYVDMKKTIIAFNTDFKNEAMLYPYVDKEVENIPQLIRYLKSLICNK